MFVKAIEDYIRSQGLNPRAVGRNDFTADNPLKFIQKLMGSCAGTVIVAFERTQIIDGVERRGSSEQKTLNNQILTTVWNQIEAAMAYVLGHPMLVVVENGAKTEGLLDAGFDWYVQRVALTPASLSTREFIGVFSDWRRKVESKSTASRVVQVDKMTLGDIFGSMKPAHLWGVVATLVALVTGAFYVGMLVPHLIK